MTDLRNADIERVGKMPRKEVMIRLTRGREAIARTKSSIMDNRWWRWNRAKKSWKAGNPGQEKRK